MELGQVVTVIFIGILLVAGFWIFKRRHGRSRYRLTGPELRNRALRESERLAELVEEREASRPSGDPVIQDHEFEHRRVTFHDEKTQEIYRKDYLPEVEALREHFDERGIHNATLDEFYESPENDADLKTISTALEEMAARLK